MSYTEIYSFGKDGKAEYAAEIKNAWRGAMSVWRELGERYFGNCNAPLDWIWGLFEKENVSEADRICLGTTFDNVLVKRENICKVIDAFRKFEGETSLPEQADALEELLKDDDVIAVGWDQTSVNADTWSNRCGYDEEKEEGIPYNCLKCTDHWWLFDDLNSQKKESEAND